MKKRPQLLSMVVLAALSAGAGTAQPVSRFVFGTYLNSYENNPLVASDADGNTYLAIPNNDAVDVRKIAKDGTVVFSNSLAGLSVNAVTVTPTGSMLIAGAVNAPEAPQVQPTQGTFQSHPKYGFVARLAPDGTLAYLATLSAIPDAVAVDASGAVYVAGVAGSSFQTTTGSFQPSINNSGCAPFWPSSHSYQDWCPHAFAAKISSDGSKLLYATFLTGSGHDNVAGVAVDAAGSLYVAGDTESADFPTTAVNLTQGVGGIFVARLDPSGGKLLFGSAFGGSSGESTAALAIGPSGEAYVAATTFSWDFPGLDGACPVLDGNTYPLVLKLNNDGQVLFSKVLSCAGSEGTSGIALSTGRRIYTGIWSYEQTYPYNIGRFFANLLNRAPMGCDPRATIVALDSTSGTLVDFEGLVGFYSISSLVSDSSGILHIAGASSANSDFVITRVPAPSPPPPTYLPLFVRLDFSRTDQFQLFCVASDAERFHTQQQYADGSPGLIISIQGKGIGPANPWQAQPGSPLPYGFNGVQVTIDGSPIPLLSASDAEILAIVPYAQTASYSAQLGVWNRDFHSVHSLRIAYEPQVIMNGESYLAAALNENGTLNSADNPAAFGSVISLFATGLGPFSPALPDNVWLPAVPPWPSLVTPISAVIQGSPSDSVQMTVLYAGPAPGESPGVYQINVRIPE